MSNFEQHAEAILKAVLEALGPGIFNANVRHQVIERAKEIVGDLEGREPISPIPPVQTTPAAPTITPGVQPQAGVPAPAPATTEVPPAK